MCTCSSWRELDLLIKGTGLRSVLFNVSSSGLNGQDAIKLEEVVNNLKDGIRIRERKKKNGKLGAREIRAVGMRG